MVQITSLKDRVKEHGTVKPKAKREKEQGTRFRKPTAEEIAAARNQVVADLVAPNLNVLFCGINPSLYSAAVGYHFARPGNRFWTALHGGGFTGRLLHPSEGAELLRLGYGITNIVDRATAAADELSTEELIAGADRLIEKVMAYRPAHVAFLGIVAYRTAFGRRRAKLGQQDETIANVPVWILPNPSGLNAHFTPAGFALEFATLRQAIENQGAKRSPAR